LNQVVSILSISVNSKVRALDGRPIGALTRPGRAMSAALDSLLQRTTNALGCF
jgi:hypothetical protein